MVEIEVPRKRERAFPTHSMRRGVGATCSRYGVSSRKFSLLYVNGNVSAEGSTKKSNGLMTVMSATRSTTISSSRDFSGNTRRATQLPYGSCCQLRKCFAGFTRSE